MIMHSVISTNVLTVGYEPQTGTMRVRFRSGGTYDYHGVNAHLFEQMLRPNPWRRIGRLVRAHAYEKVA